MSSESANAAMQSDCSREQVNQQVEQPSQEEISPIDATNTTQSTTPDFTEIKPFTGRLTYDLVRWYKNKVMLKDRDEENNLDLYCYNQCDNTSDEVVQACRGVVFKGQELIMQGFPYTREFSEQDPLMREILEPIFDKCLFFDSKEGSCVRMFAIKNESKNESKNDQEPATYKWYTSTHRKLDAFKSKWASKESFGLAFIKALEEEVLHNSELHSQVGDVHGLELLNKFQSTCLDPNKQYMFLVCSTNENRIVCQPPSKPRLYHVGTFTNHELTFESMCIPTPKRFNFTNLDHLLDHLSRESNYKFSQGVIVFAPGNKQYKVYEKTYYDLFQVRGNEPSIKFRYLQVRNDRRMVSALRHLYPTMEKTFDMYEDILDNIGHLIYQAYVNRFIRKQFIKVPTEEFSIMKECHSWHEQDRRNKVSLDYVMEVMNNQHPSALNRMIHRFLENEQAQPLLPLQPVQESSQQAPVYRGTRDTYTRLTHSAHATRTPVRAEQDTHDSSSYRGNTNYTRGRGRGRSDKPLLPRHVPMSWKTEQAN